jgi:alpha-tubulin suppressor-like RCC1 family protein
LLPSNVQFHGTSGSQFVKAFPIQADAGESHTAFITKDGMAYTCGNGAYGRLGHGEEGKTECILYYAHFLFNVYY